MAQPAADNNEYFLGLNGEQSGPFSQQALLQKIESKSIPQDALVWHQGMDSWLPINSLSPFKEAFSAPPKAEGMPSVPPPGNATRAATPPPPRKAQFSKPAIRAKGMKSSERADFDGLPNSTFADKNTTPAPVFKGQEGVFSRPKFLETRMGIMLVAFSGLTLISGVVFFFWANSGPDPNQRVQRIKPKAPAVTRDSRLRKALSQLTIDSHTSLNTLKALISENPTDAVGKQALEKSVTYYKRNRRPIEAGNALRLAKKPLEASKFYLLEPPNYVLAEQSLYEAYKVSKDKNQQFELLKKNIQILLGPLKKKKVAIERIKILQKDFARKSHPYGYYLKPTQKKITDIFNRLSNQFNETLKGYLEVEFPEMELIKKPLIQLKKDRKGLYRIIASYSGPIKLDRDRLPKMKLRFWMYDERWYLIETNLTEQRAKWAREEKKRLVSKIYSPEEVLELLETLFSTQYPKKALYELVSGL